MGANYDDNEGDEDSGSAFNFSAVSGESMVAGEFFADNDKKTRQRVNKTVYGVGSNSERAGNEPDNDIKNA